MVAALARLAIITARRLFRKLRAFAARNIQVKSTIARTTKIVTTSSAQPPKETARRFYYDTVGHGSHAALTCAVLAYGADHVLVGSDYPVLHSFETYERTINWPRDVALPAGAVEQIMEGTAAKVLGL